MQIEMTIKGLMVDPITNLPIIILRDKDGQRVLPIWVGVYEANAIAMQMENVATPRPMTHDLLKNVICDLKADIQKIVVSDLRENTFYALIYLVVNGEPVAIDARPSDAIALALRAQAATRCSGIQVGTRHTLEPGAISCSFEHVCILLLTPPHRLPTMAGNPCPYIQLRRTSDDRCHRQSKRRSREDHHRH